MQETFTAEDIKNIGVLIQRVPDIKGTEATAVAILLQKIQRMYEVAVKAETPTTPTEVKKEEAAKPPQKP